MEAFVTRGAQRLILAATVPVMAFAVHPSPQARQVRVTQLPTVWVIGTGGTIAGRGTSAGASVYKPGVITAEELLTSVPEITQYANVKVEQLFNASSTRQRPRVVEAYQQHFRG
jgi:L-asparaginase/Glu-tRNA(Gln) amidotransferase subunit D